jgi:hypothetical protein
MSQRFLTLEGVPYDYDESLDGIWGRLKQAFTPPRAVRRAISKSATAFAKAVVDSAKFARKAVPYTPFGFVAATWMTADQRKKAFGMSDKENKYYEIATKVNRGMAITAAVVATAIVAGPAVLSAMGPSGSIMGGAASTGTAGTAGAAGTGWMGLLSSGGGMLLNAGQMVYKLTQKPSGEQQLDSYNTSAIPGAESLPLNTPVPVFPHSEGSVFAPYVAGSGSLRPGGEEAIPRRVGELRPSDPMRSFDVDSALDISSVDPGNISDFESFGKKLTPMQDALIRGSRFDALDIRELMASSQASDTTGVTQSLSNADGSYSLKGLLNGIRHGVVKRSPGYIAKSRRSAAPSGSLTDMVRKGRGNRRISRATANIASQTLSGIKWPTETEYKAANAYMSWYQHAATSYDPDDLARHQEVIRLYSIKMDALVPKRYDQGGGMVRRNPTEAVAAYLKKQREEEEVENLLKTAEAKAQASAPPPPKLATVQTAEQYAKRIQDTRGSSLFDISQKSSF